MDERAASELGLGNSIMNQASATTRTINQNIGSIKKGYENLNQANIKASTTDKEEDYGIDAKDGFTMLGDVRRLQGSLGRASQLYQRGGQVAGARGLLKQGRDVSTASLLRNPPSKVGTLKTFVSPSFQKSEFDTGLSYAGERIGQIGEETGEATEQAASGLPRVFQKVAEVAGESGKSAAAIGDVVGHGLGVATAGYGIVKDISGGWSTMDADQKRGNVLGIAGGIADAVSTAIPLLAPVAIALNIASAGEDEVGDYKEAAFKKKTQLDPQQASQVASQRASMPTPTAVATTGQVAMKTQPVRPQRQGGVAVF
jgi:hypothetical protein